MAVGQKFDSKYANRVSFVYGFYLGLISMVLVLAIAQFSDEILGKNKKITRLEHEVSI